MKIKTLESFKLSDDDKKSYKQLGNSVNVDNVYTVISSTLKHYGFELPVRNTA